MRETPSAPAEATAGLTEIAVAAHPVGSFRQVSEVRDALRGVPGVRAVSVLRFYRGKLQLRVDYDDLRPLAARIRDLDGFASARITQEDARVIDLAIGG